MATKIMTTKTTDATEVAQTVNAATQSIIERLQTGHERFAEALCTSRARSARVADKFVEILLAGQREAIELSKSISIEPTAYGKNMETFVQSLSTAQERMLDLAKTVYREQAEAAVAVRGLAERAIESGKTFTKTFEQFNPLRAAADK